MYSVIIYDCDGTILDSKYVTVRAYEGLLNRRLNEKEADDIFHQTRLETFKMLGLEDNESNNLKIEYLYESGMKNIKPFPGAIDMLNKIKSLGVHQGMATNREFLSAKFAYNSNDIDDYLEDFVSASDVNKPKPSGDMLLFYIVKHNLNPKNTLFVGNSITDHMAALDVGIDFAYCDWGTDYFHEKSAIILKEPMDLVEILK